MRRTDAMEPTLFDINPPPAKEVDIPIDIARRIATVRVGSHQRDGVMSFECISVAVYLKTGVWHDPNSVRMAYRSGMEKLARVAAEKMEIGKIDRRFGQKEKR